jgi:hypothetical protein
VDDSVKLVATSLVSNPMRQHIVVRCRGCLSIGACSSGVSVPPSKIGDELRIHVSDAERRSLTMQHKQETTMDVLQHEVEIMRSQTPSALTSVRVLRYTYPSLTSSIDSYMSVS